MDKEMFLLGAGASVEAGVPASYEKTEKMLDKFSNDSQYRTFNRILQFVVGGLLFQSGADGKNPFGGVNIEDLFNTIDLLGNRSNSELTPFIGSWHPLLQNFQIGDMSDSAAQNLLRDIYKPMKEYMSDVLKNKSFLKVNDFGVRSQFQRDFSEAVKQSLGSKSQWLFHQTNEIMIEKLIEMVWLKDENSIQYIIPFIKHCDINDSSIATLNYDNSIEFTGQLLGKEIDTGFSSWSKTGEFKYQTKKIRLLKLHGSIDWSLISKTTNESMILPFQTIEQVDIVNPQQENFRPAIVFGGKNKLSAVGPSLSLMRAFEKELNKCTKLTCVGYSFHDDHVNEFIRIWLNGKQTRILQIVDPKFNESTGEFIDLLKRIINSQTSNRVITYTEGAGTFFRKL